MNEVFFGKVRHYLYIPLQNRIPIYLVLGCFALYTLLLWCTPSESAVEELGHNTIREDDRTPGRHQLRTPVGVANVHCNQRYERFTFMDEWVDACMPL